MSFSYRRVTALVLILTGLSSTSSLAATPITLQLRWLHQFQFAGYYAAHNKGYYKDAGLDVTLKEGGPGINPVEEVLSGHAEFGVSNSSLVLDFLKGREVLLLGPVFQHSPNILIARGGIGNPSDLVNAGPVALMGGDQDVELTSMFLNEGIPLDKLHIVPDQNHLDDLTSGRVAAINAYLSNEPFQLQQRGIPFSILKPGTYGMDFYGDALFSRNSLTKTQPEVVAAFLAASVKGWDYALEHPEEIIDLIVAQYNSQNKSRAHLQYEARTLTSLISPDLIRIGHNNPGRWQHIANTYARFGLAPANAELKGFLYEGERKADLSRLYQYLAAALGLIGLVSAIAGYIFRVNRRLAGTISKLYEEQTARAESEAQMRTLADTAAAGIFVLQGTQFVMVNPALVSISGYSHEEILELELPVLVHPDHQTLMVDRACAQQRGEQAASRYEVKMITKQGETRWVELTAGQISFRGQPSCIGTVYDITERHNAEEQVRHMAQHDALTGLANRALLADRLCQAIVVARRDGTRLALMYLDLDKFKPVNDEFGHAVGDQLLKAVADRITASVRESDAIARLGGDEFVVLLRAIDTDSKVLHVAEKIRQNLSQPFEIEGHILQISSSIGIALFPDHGADDVELSKHADIAMYLAKNSGRDTVRLFQPGDTL